MRSDIEARWALAVRVLAITTALLLVVSVLEARAIRRARGDLQQLRQDRDAMEAGVASAWTRQPAEETARAIRWLDDFYREPSEGLGRPGGLCPGGHLDEQPIATDVMGILLTARASGKSWDMSLRLMRDAIVRTDAYRAVHPEPALPRGDPDRR